MRKKVYEVQLYDKFYIKKEKLAVIAICNEEVEEKLKNSDYDYYDFDIFQDMYDVDNVIV